MAHAAQGHQHSIAGFGVLDDKGRLPVAKALRETLGLRPGSAVAYVVIDGMLLLIPQDEQLARMTTHAATALARAGLTTDDLLEAIPAARADVMRDLYGNAFADELAQVQASSTRGE